MLRSRADRRPYPDRAKLEIARRFRRHPTAAEQAAWSLLRDRGVLGLKFRRQHVIQDFIVDFYCASLRLVLELDGASHTDPAHAGYDAARTEWLEARGYRVCRIANDEVTRESLENLLRGLRHPLSR